LAFTPRFVVLTLAVLLTLLFVALIEGGAAPRLNGLFAVVAVLFGALTALGLRDLQQTRHAVLRNYPIAAHLRFILEHIRPEMRQYFFESETDGLPFSRTQRGIVYQRAKMALDKRPFGTLRDTNAQGYEWLRHAEARRDRRLPDRGRRAGLRQALFDVGLQHLRHELRGLERQRDPRAEQGRGARRLRPRHGRGRL